MATALSRLSLKPKSKAAIRTSYVMEFTQAQILLTQLSGFKLAEKGSENPEFQA